MSLSMPRLGELRRASGDVLFHIYRALSFHIIPAGQSTMVKGNLRRICARFQESNVPPLPILGWNLQIAAADPR